MRIVVFFAFWWASFLAFSQQKYFDRIELFYSQTNYKKTYRYAQKLLNNPELDEYPQPKLFQSLSAFHLSFDKRWIKKHPNTFNEATQLYKEFLNSYPQINENDENKFSQHINELIVYLQEQVLEFQETEEHTKSQEIKLFLQTISENVSEKTSAKTSTDNFLYGEINNRKQLIKFATQQLNVPYLYGGNSPKGFDCSGFVAYVFQQYSISIPRTSQDQYLKAEKIQKTQVKPGDLIFFDSGKGVNHVGIVVSEIGEPIKMIHASTNSGVVVTEVEDSTYWKQRIKGYGTFLKQ